MNRLELFNRSIDYKRTQSGYKAPNLKKTGPRVLSSNSKMQGPL